jgi:hypothetical protein
MPNKVLALLWVIFVFSDGVTGKFSINVRVCSIETFG